MTFARTAALCTFPWFLLACQIDKPLGDLEELAGAGGEAAGDGGTSSGGTGGGTPGGASSTGGAPGGASSTGGAPGGASSTGGAPGGASFGGGGGAGPSGGSGGDARCFSPDNNPELALDGAVPGCACEGDQSVCVVVESDLPFHLVALLCREGRWFSAEDGPCAPTTGTSCLVGNRLYRGGATMPDPFSCNTCTCVSGPDVCTERDCPIPCPAGTEPMSRCIACGMLPGGCDIVESGCFPRCEDDDQCDAWSSCIDGACNVGPCI